MDDHNVIIIDDDPVIVLVHQVLVRKSKLSAQPVAFLSGQEALNYLDACDHKKKRRRLLLLDINMPGVSGWDLLDIINSKPYAANIFAIIISSSIDAKDKQKAKSYRQVIGYLEKPIQLKQLLEFDFSDSFS